MQNLFGYATVGCSTKEKSSMHGYLLLTPDEIKKQFPLKSEAIQFLAESRFQAKQILLGVDPRLAIIVGPCSIHDMDSAY